MDNQDYFTIFDQDDEEIKPVEKKNGLTFYILNIAKLILSFVPYIYVLVIAVGGIHIGLQGNDTYYGFEALEKALFPVTGLFSSVGVVSLLVPLCLIYQIHFIVRHKSDLKLMIAVAAMVVIALVATLMLEPVSKEYRYSHVSVPNIVAEYLVETYGQKSVLSMRILEEKESFDNEYTEKEYSVYNVADGSTIKLTYTRVKNYDSGELTETVTDEQGKVFRDGAFVTE
ncbi:MAG: hypothetical protein K6F92_08825 [Lachnospiraceae bacterium]|nr:hypothetical protein [Lachnospiraceae bacterium]